MTSHQHTRSGNKEPDVFGHGDGIRGNTLRGRGLAVAALVSCGQITRAGDFKSGDYYRVNFELCLPAK